jgi:CelD/BcsL family acetyltransferase involved in cellulose biosynthesis
MNFSHINDFPAELKPEWDTLLANGICHVPFLRFDSLQTWWNTRGGGEWPQDSRLVIILAHDGDRLVGIAPCFIADCAGRKTFMLLGSLEIFDYLDLLVKPQHTAAFTRGLIEYIRTDLSAEYGFKRVEFDNIPDNSPSLKALRNACQEIGIEFSTEPLSRSPYISLNGDYEEYLAGLDKKQRHEMRRKMRRLLELPQGSDWYIASDPNTIENEIEEFLRLMAFDEEKKKFLTPAMVEQMRLSMLDAFKHKYLQLAFLTIGGQKAAAYLDYDFNNRIWVYNSGIDPQFFEHSPGWVLLMHLIKWSIENGRFEFDFMRGNEDYKYKFGAIDRNVMQISIDLA